MLRNDACKFSFGVEGHIDLEHTTALLKSRNVYREKSSTSSEKTEKNKEDREGRKTEKKEDRKDREEKTEKNR